MDKNLLFLILSLVAFWFILDDFYGQRRITNMVNQMVNGGAVVDKQLTPLPPTAGDPAPINPNLS